MKKVLLGILVCLACLAMVSCSMDQYAQLGELMGNMGNNIYGIKANMKDVDETAEKFDSAVGDYETIENEDGTTTVVTKVELVKTEDLVASVASIKNSPQKTEELQKKLDEPLASATATAEEKKAIQTALQNKMDEVIKSATVKDETLDKLDNDGVKEAYQAVTNALDNIKSGISENPTKADLATVSIVSDLATAVSDLASKLTDSDSEMTDEEKTNLVLEQADKAFAALDALKVTTTAANIDILQDLNFTSLFKSATSKNTPENSTSRDIETSSEDDTNEESSSDDGSTKDDFSQYEDFLEDVFKSVIKMVTENDGSFSDEKYNRFMFQLRAIKTAYEMTAWLATPTYDSSTVEVEQDGAKEFVFVDALLGKSIKATNKFSTNDAVLYTIAFVLTEGDNFYQTYGTENNKDAVKSILEHYAWYFNGEHSEEEYKTKWNEVEDALKNFNKEGLKSDAALAPLVSKVKTALNTDLVILLDAGFNLKDMLATFKVLESAKAETYADALYNALEDLKKELNNK